jgi:hypothetical protein
MRWRGIIATVGLAALVLLAACSPEPTPIAKCVAANFPSYDPKNKEQCIAACIKCENGLTTTCATACSLKGNR